MIDVKRLLVFATALLACVCIWGCGEGDFRQWGGRYEGALVSIIDDSLALLTNSRKYEDCHKVFMGGDECERGGMNDGLFLINYRKKQAPYWGDTIDGKIEIIRGFYGDSSVFFSNVAGEFGFWKIGENPRIVRKWKCESPCECHRSKYGRPWKNGNILLKMEQQDDCPYAILDTVTGNIKKLADKYTWLNGCDDIIFIDGETVCLKALYDGKKYGVYEYGEKGIMDSLIWNGASWSIYTKKVLEICGRMLMVKHPATMLDGASNSLNGTYIHFLKPLKTSSLPVRLEYNNFIDSKGFSINYSAVDLIVTK